MSRVSLLVLSEFTDRSKPNASPIIFERDHLFCGRHKNFESEKLSPWKFLEAATEGETINWSTLPISFIIIIQTSEAAATPLSAFCEEKHSIRYKNPVWIWLVTTRQICSSSIQDPLRFGSPEKNTRKVAWKDRYQPPVLSLLQTKPSKVLTSHCYQ